MSENNGEVYTREEVEYARKEEMREHLIQTFDGESILYEIYKNRNWLDKLFTDPILSMDRNTQYVTSQVAAICETQVYNINNRRRELIDYLRPETYGEGNSKTFKHNYLSVFKMKMVMGLTGEGSEYSVPNLKEIIYSGSKPHASQTKSTDKLSGDQLYKIMNAIEQFDKFKELIESDEFFIEIDRRVKQTTDKLLVASTKDAEAEKSSRSLYEYIISGHESLLEKEGMLKKFDELASDYPHQNHTVQMYKTAAEERITRFKQDEREFNINKLKERVVDLIDQYSLPTKSENEREIIRTQISRIATDNPDLSFEIRMWLSTQNKERPKKGIFARIFTK